MSDRMGFVYYDFRRRIRSEDIGLLFPGWEGAKERVLILCPHDDDGVLGAGYALLAAQDAGAQVHVAIFCDGWAGYSRPEEAATIVERRRAETVTAYRMLGLVEDRIHRFDYPDFSLWPWLGWRLPGGQEGTDARVLPVLRRLAPTRLLVPNGYREHIDHEATYRVGTYDGTQVGDAILAQLGTAEPIRSYLQYAVWGDFAPEDGLVAGTPAVRANRAILAPQETEVLFETLRSMTAQGKSVIFISHKLQEVMAISERVTVLRKGRITATGVPVAGATRQDLARLMVGRDVVFQLDKKPQEAGAVVLKVENIHAENDKGLPAVRGMSFEIRAGEIYGLAGVAGNGQRELSQVISGLRKCTQGRILLNGAEVNNHPAAYAIQRGLAYVPEDRTHVGSSPNLSVTDNVIMKNYRQEPISHGWMLDIPAAQHFARELKEAYNIVVPTIETPVRLLSGGNLQRVILAREISGRPALLVAVQPTRGLDVGAIEGVHRLLLAQREAGAAILLISEELEELLSLSDRVAVIYEGRLMGELRDPDVETVGLMMTGTPLEQIQKQEPTHG